MRYLLLFLFWLTTQSHSQQDTTISTIDYVQIVNNNHEEANFYYQNNWKTLREKAVKRGYIQSFHVFETPYSEGAPFHIMLITTYANTKQYEAREKHFGLLIKEAGSLKLLNDKKPNEFRKTLFSKENVRHWK